MENKIEVFNNEEFGSVRTVMINGEPWFVGKDVAEILGYAKSRNAIAAHVDDEDKKDAPIQGDLGGEQNMTIINESGLYSLILSSKLPNAKKFKKWVTSEVLPSIHKHGLYAMDEILENPDIAINALISLKEERAKRKALESTVAVQSQQITEMKPKATYYDIVLQCKDLISTSAIAKDYGKSAIWMNRYLNEKGIQFKQGDIWLLYQKYAENGYTSTKTVNFVDSNGESHAKVHTYWTQKGRLFIYDLMKSDGHLPLIEQENICKAV